MNLEQMVYVKEIIKTGSFTEAAHNLYVSQSTISQAIRSLENELGIQLFHRSRIGIRPTDAGKEIINYAFKIVTNMESIRNEAKRHVNPFHGQLHIASTPTLMQVLPKTLARFKKEFPQVDVMITEHESSWIIDQVSKNHIDIGLIATDKRIADLIFTLFDYTTDFKVIVSKNNSHALSKSIHIRELKNYPLVIHTSQFWQNFIRIYTEHYGAPNILFSTSNLEVIKKTVAEDLAIAILSNYLLVEDPYVHTEQIIPISVIGNHFTSSFLYGSIFSERHQQLPLVKRFIKYLHPTIKG